MQFTASRLRVSASCNLSTRICQTLTALCPSQSASLRNAFPYIIRRKLTSNGSPIESIQNRNDTVSTIAVPYQEESFNRAESLNGAPWAQHVSLPQSCPGCGALTQESDANSPGFYSKTRKSVRHYFKACRDEASSKREDIVGEASDEPTKTAKPAAGAVVPICDRCHNLVYNSSGQPIAHPSIDDIADSIAESPFARNHIYHVIDAADFPLSLMPTIFSKLSLAKPRSRNRRSQHDFSSKPTLSFIITRSDLLGPTKEIVDGMMPYFQSVLRDTLGRAGQDLRLGNVHLVSAKRGWWTSDIKESIWKRGGGNWLVGKVNVGKSNLLEVLFPKSSARAASPHGGLKNGMASLNPVETQESETPLEILPEDSLLPPAQPERLYPSFPIVSSLPGTTASPIRLPFGNRRGEVIDLPGLERNSLEKYVQDAHRLDLIMVRRNKVQQHVIKPGQSLIMGGGLIRITPELKSDDSSTVMLAYPFLPLDTHVTSTDKAISQQLQQRQSGIKSILADGAGSDMASAGVYQLKTDVTKSRAGPMLRAGTSQSRLPFRVWATDVLIEGVGWVELVCQTRRWSGAARPVSGTDSQCRNVDQSMIDGARDTEPDFVPFAKGADIAGDRTDFIPSVQVFSPNGKHVAQRQSLEAWQRWTDARNTRQSRSKGR